MQLEQTLLNKLYFVLSNFGGQFDLWLTDQLNNNDFLIGFVVTGALGVAAYFARSVPSMMWRAVVRMLTIEVIINSDSPHFYSISQYVNNHVLIPFLRRKYAIGGANASKNRTVIYDGNNLQAADKKPHKALLQAGYGDQFGWWGGTLLRVKRELLKSDSGEFKEQLHLTILGRRQRTLNTLLEKSVDTEVRDEIEVYTSSGDYWQRLKSLRKRHMDSIVVPHTKKETLLSQIETFLASKDFYVETGIPYHIGLLFHGEPGCGKSSMIHAIASHFNRDIYFLSLNSVKEDEDLYSLLSYVKQDSILVIEDIDVTKTDVTRDQRRDRGISLSALLNILDGIMAVENQIIIATTNRIEVLDPALVRRGRFDVQIEFLPASFDEMLEIAGRFQIDRAVLEELRDRYVPLPHVTLQGIFFEKNSPADIIKAIDEQITKRKSC